MISLYYNQQIHIKSHVDHTSWPAPTNLTAFSWSEITPCYYKYQTSFNYFKQYCIVLYLPPCTCYIYTQLKIFGRDTGGRGWEMVEHKAENWQSLGSGNRVALVECPLFDRDSAVNLYLSSAKYLPKIVRLLFLQ